MFKFFGPEFAKTSGAQAKPPASDRRKSGAPGTRSPSDETSLCLPDLAQVELLTQRKPHKDLAHGHERDRKDGRYKEHMSLEAGSQVRNCAPFNVDPTFLEGTPQRSDNKCMVNIYPRILKSVGHDHGLGLGALPFQPRTGQGFQRTQGQS